MKNQTKKSNLTPPSGGVSSLEKGCKKRSVASVLSALFLFLFILWTILVKYVDVKAIGPNCSSVGFANFNGLVHKLTGYNNTLYVVTDWLGLVPVFICLVFGLLGLKQLIQRRSLKGVDADLLALGVFYVVLALVYLTFEKIKINYRPVLIGGILETSYPSSTTLLVTCVMPTAIMQFSARIKNQTARKIVCITATLFTAFMVVGRVVAGVHWITDIIGGALISASLVLIYYHFLVKTTPKKD